MKRKTSIVISFLTLAFGCQPVAFAMDSTASQPAKENNIKTNKDVRSESPFGYETTTPPERIIKIVPGKTRSIRVTRLEAVRISDGTVEVKWMFDTFGLPSFPLAMLHPNWTGITVHMDESPFYSH